MKSSPGAVDLASNPDYLLFDLIKPDHLRFVKVEEETYRNSAFLDNRITPVPTDVYRIPFSAISHHVEKRIQPITLVVAHTSFCGSTLLARCTQSPVLLMLREPAVLGALANLFRYGDSNEKSLNDKMNVCWNLLGKKYNAHQTVGIKLSNYCHNLLAPLSRSWPDMYFVFLYGGLDDFLISMLKHRVEAEKKLGVFLSAYLQDAEIDTELRHHILNLPLLKKAAWVWSLQVSLFCRTAQSGIKHFRFLPAAKFFSSPLETVEALCSWCNIAYETKSQTSWVEHCLAHDAKSISDVPGRDIRSSRSNIKERYATQIAETLSWAEKEGLMSAQDCLDTMPRL